MAAAADRQRHVGRRRRSQPDRDRPVHSSRHGSGRLKMDVGHDHVVDVRGDQPVARSSVPSALSWQDRSPASVRVARSAPPGCAGHRRREVARCAEMRHHTGRHGQAAVATAKAAWQDGFVFVACGAPPCAVAIDQGSLAASFGRHTSPVALGGQVIRVRQTGYHRPPMRFPRVVGGVAQRCSPAGCRCTEASSRPSSASRQRYRHRLIAPRARRSRRPPRPRRSLRSTFRWRSSPASRTSSPSSPSTS